MPTIQVINHTQNMFRRKEPIQYIVLHYSASTKSTDGSAMDTVRTLDQRGFSSDFAVDDDNIIQFADNPAAWASKACQRPNSNGTPAGRGSSNSNSVSIEMSSMLLPGGKWVPNDPMFKFSDQVLENTAYLCKLLIAKYNIPKEHIIRHYDIVGKQCPGIIGWNTNHNEAFENFRDSLYDGSDPVSVNDTDYTFGDYTSTVVSKKTNRSSTNNQKTNYKGTNNVYKLSGFAKGNVLSQTGDRKDEFKALRNSMVNNAPDMGRDILMTSELYDSNILKGDQESKKERI